MLRSLLFFYCITVVSVSSFGQTIDSLKLTDAEIPSTYSKSQELLCETPHASSFYSQTDLYESFIGKVVRKEFQSFDKKGDKGSILYFQFENEFKAEGFLESLLWGQGKKPSKSEPDEYYVKGQILIIWSFKYKSEIKDISKSKIKNLLK